MIITLSAPGSSGFPFNPFCIICHDNCGHFLSYLVSICLRRETMQSFFQYRRFLIHLENQYERDREKTAALVQQQRSARHQSLAASAPSTSSSPSSSEEPSKKSSKSPLPDVGGDHRDLEKGEGSPSPSSASPPPRIDGPISSTREKTGAPIDADKAGHSTLPVEPAEPAEELAEPTPQLSRHSTLHTTPSATGTALGIALTGVSVRSRSPARGGKVFVVGYEGPNDSLNPHNWSYATRIFATILVAGIGFVVGVASSIDAEALRPAAAEFGVSEVVESLATGEFVFSLLFRHGFSVKIWGQC